MVNKLISLFLVCLGFIGICNLSLADGLFYDSRFPEKCLQYSEKQSVQWSCSHFERYIPTLESRQNLLEKELENKVILIKVERFLEQGDSSYDIGEYHKAEQAYRQALALDRTAQSAWLKLALLYSDLNRDADALQTLHNGIAQLPDDADILHEMGLIQARMRLLSEAIVSLAKAALMAPENAHYSYVYGIAMNSYQRPDEALDILQKAYILHPDNEEIIMALVSINQDNHHNIEALKYGQKLLSLDPDNPSLQNFVNQLKSDKTSVKK